MVWEEGVRDVGSGYEGKRRVVWFCQIYVQKVVSLGRFYGGGENLSWVLR